MTSLHEEPICPPTPSGGEAAASWAGASRRSSSAFPLRDSCSFGQFCRSYSFLRGTLRYTSSYTEKKKRSSQSCSAILSTSASNLQLLYKPFLFLPGKLLSHYYRTSILALKAFLPVHLLWPQKIAPTFATLIQNPMILSRDLNLYPHINTSKHASRIGHTWSRITSPRSSKDLLDTV